MSALGRGCSVHQNINLGECRQITADFSAMSDRCYQLQGDDPDAHGRDIGKSDNDVK